ncbi:type IV pilin [Salinadaptatus halalkaliphilus]
MVAITVILAAVIAAFVMDMGNMNESANAGIDFSVSGDTVTVQVISEGNTDAIYVEYDDGTDVEPIAPDGSHARNPWTVGDSAEIAAPESITVYGELGGDEQVIANWNE